MVSVHKIVGVQSCGFLLCLGLSHAAQAENKPGSSDVMKTFSVTYQEGFSSDDDKPKNVNNAKGSNRADGAKTIKGTVLRVEGDNVFVKGQDGKEVRVHVDNTTQMGKDIERGEPIEAKVNDQHHALSILSGPAVTDRRNDKE